MSDLSAEQVHRYARHILLPDVGGVGQRHLLASSVLVEMRAESASEEVALAYLAAAGVGTLWLSGAIHTSVERVDVARGLLLGEADIGRERFAAIRERLRAINPDVSVRVAPAGSAIAAMPLVGAMSDGDSASSSPLARAQALARALAVGGMRAASTLARLLERRHHEGERAGQESQPGVANDAPVVSRAE